MEVKIRDYIINYIEAMEESEDQKLPSENEISEKFDLSRHKVRSVYDSLEQMGLVYSKQGIGRFVHRKIPEVNLSLSSVSFTEKMKEDKVPLETKNLGLVKLDEKSASFYKKLGLKGNIYKISRLRILYGKEAVIHSSYVGDGTFPNIEKEGSQIESIHSYYKSKGIRNLTDDGKTMTVKFPREEEIKIFKCGNLVALLNMISLVKNKDTGEIIEYTDVVYRSDIFRYKIQ